jgi:hypothetical protein
MAKAEVNARRNSFKSRHEDTHWQQGMSSVYVIHSFIHSFLTSQGALFTIPSSVYLLENKISVQQPLQE